MASARVMTQGLAAALNRDAFYHDVTGKDVILQRFRDKERRIMATSAFGLEIDIADIRLVMHIGWPRTLLDYAQDSGRAGRDGADGEAVVVIYETQLGECGGYLDGRLVEQFVEGPGCERCILDEYLDG